MNGDDGAIFLLKRGLLNAAASLLLFARPFRPADCGVLRVFRLPPVAGDAGTGEPKVPIFRGGGVPDCPMAEGFRLGAFIREGALGAASGRGMPYMESVICW